MQEQDATVPVIKPMVLDFGVVASRAGGGVVEVQATSEPGVVLVRVEEPQVNVGAMIDSGLQPLSVLVAPALFIALSLRLLRLRTRHQRVGCLYCPACNYEVGELSKCPECGTGWEKRKPVIGRTRKTRVRKLAWCTAIFALLAVATTLLNPPQGAGLFERLGVLSTSAVPVADALRFAKSSARWRHLLPRTTLYWVQLATGKSMHVRLPEKSYRGSGYLSKDGALWVCGVASGAQYTLDYEVIALPRAEVVARVDDVWPGTQPDLRSFYSMSDGAPSLGKKAAEGSLASLPSEFVTSWLAETKDWDNAPAAQAHIAEVQKQLKSVMSRHVDAIKNYWIAHGSAADASEVLFSKVEPDGSMKLMQRVTRNELALWDATDATRTRMSGPYSMWVYAFVVSGDGNWIVAHMPGGLGEMRIVRLPTSGEIKKEAVTTAHPSVQWNNLKAISHDGRYAICVSSSSIDVLEFSSGTLALRCDARVTKRSSLTASGGTVSNPYLAVRVSVSEGTASSKDVLAVFRLPDDLPVSSLSPVN